MNNFGMSHATVAIALALFDCYVFDFQLPMLNSEWIIGNTGLTERLVSRGVKIIYHLSHFMFEILTPAKEGIRLFSTTHWIP